MSERQATRAELIERLRNSSKDAVVMAEMKRLGFWPADQGKPDLEAALIAREAELHKTLQRLHTLINGRVDPASALKQMRRERMEASLVRREANAQAREKARHDRALRWHANRDTHTGFLGRGVSGGLQATATEATVPSSPSSPTQLSAPSLPTIESPQALAAAMGIANSELKFLCFHREVARISHYRRFALPKKTGGERIISAPMPRLKRAQYWVLDNVLAKVPCHEAAHGFLPGRSIVTNATPHCGQAVVINLDLKNFFPSVAYPRIKGVFRGLGYSEPVATVLALLCSENASDELEVDGEHYFVGGKARDRVLPQGAPTSPMLTNVLCRQLDRRLTGAARKLGFVYTRYADDLTFSLPAVLPDLTVDRQALCGKLLRQVHFIVRDEGFTPHPDKQHVMRAGARQEVTGIVVNDTPSVSRTQRRALRAALHRARTQGLASTTWQGHAATPSVLVGFAQFVQMVNARQGAGLLRQARALAGPSGSSTAAPDTFRVQAARGEAPPRAAGAWWTPAPRPLPELQLTAGQQRAERQARLNAQRAERRATRLGLPVPPRANRASGPDATGDPSGLDTNDTPDSASARRPPLTSDDAWRLIGQSALLLWGASRASSTTALIMGCVWMAYAMYTRRLGWGRYFVALFVILWLARHLK